MQNQPLYPVYENGTVKVGEITKKVQVKNIGTSDAYIRTWFAFEAGNITSQADLDKLIIANFGSASVHVAWLNGVYEIKDQNYFVGYVLYPEAVKPNDSVSSLESFYMSSEANNDDVAQFGDTYEVLVLSQAVQKNNMPDAATAMTAAFGNNHPWTDGVFYAKVTKLNANSQLFSVLSPSTVILDKGLTINVNGETTPIQLDTAYQFEPSMTYDEGKASKYAKWHADYVVYADKAVPANSIGLAGYYDLYGSYLKDYSWVMMQSDEDIPADFEIRLMEELGVSVNYEELCNFGNDGIGFLCGAVKLTDKLPENTKLTVELRLYETEEPSEANSGSSNVETGDYEIVGTFTYTFN